MTRTATYASSCLPSRLDIEWAHLRTSRAALRSARRWSAHTDDTPLTSIIGDIDDLDLIVRATQGGQPGADGSLLRLVEIATHDDLAGRVVLQRILPGLIHAAMPYRSFHDDIHPIDVVIPAAWMAIRCYDASKRTHDVAASLISDAVFQAFRRPLRRHAATEEIREPRVFAAELCEDGPANAVDELIEVITEARRAGVSTRDIDLLRHLVRAGSPSAVARERDVTPRTVRNHRDRAVANVRSALAVAA